MDTRALLLRCALVSALACLAGARSHSAPGEAPTEDQAIVLKVGRLFTMNSSNEVFTPGMLITRGGKIAYVGPPTEVPAGAEEIDFAHGWACPGMVDLHTHIHTGGFGDINDMVQAVN